MICFRFLQGPSLDTLYHEEKQEWVSSVQHSLFLTHATFEINIRFDLLLKHDTDVTRRSCLEWVYAKF